MRFKGLIFAVAAAAVTAGVVVACGSGGNGIGTAPEQPPPCAPTAPGNGAACKGPQVCSYDTCGAAGAGPCVALCPSLSDVWSITLHDDGGTFADAPPAETGETGDAEAGTDAETDATDSAAESSTDSAIDAATDSGAEAAADSALDVLPDLGLDVLGD